MPISHQAHGYNEESPYHKSFPRTLRKTTKVRIKTLQINHLDRIGKLKLAEIAFADDDIISQRKSTFKKIKISKTTAFKTDPNIQKFLSAGNNFAKQDKISQGKLTLNNNIMEYNNKPLNNVIATNTHGSHNMKKQNSCSYHENNHQDFLSKC